MVEIYPSSGKIRKKNYFPWADLEVGQSFVVAHTQIKGPSLRANAYIVGKKLGKKFSVTDHGEQVGYEVGRIK